MSRVGAKKGPGSADVRFSETRGVWGRGPGNFCHFKVPVVPLVANLSNKIQDFMSFLSCELWEMLRTGGHLGARA